MDVLIIEDEQYIHDAISQKLGILTNITHSYDLEESLNYIENEKMKKQQEKELKNSYFNEKLKLIAELELQLKDLRYVDSNEELEEYKIKYDVFEKSRKQKEKNDQKCGTETKNRPGRAPLCGTVKLGRERAFQHPVPEIRIERTFKIYQGDAFRTRNQGG